ncbi:tetratricopeptide repeat protein [Kiritimatiellota bacterium B12222]|nr:tetratricopeptide repeat protein [Kiritimatiellota bacterium B12222]
MKKNLLLYLVSFSALAFAQQRPVSILNQLPYVPERVAPSEGMLDVQAALQGLDPLPAFGIPQQLPLEFVVSPVRRELIAQSQKANVFMMEGKPEKSVEIFKEILAERPEESGIRVALADSLYAMGNHAEAAVEYRAVLETNPMNFQCLNNLAWLLATTSDLQIKDVDAALEYAQDAKVIQPTSHHLWSTLSQIYYELGRYGEAERAINNALVIAQQSQVNLEVVVSYLVQRDRSALALQATSLLP